MDLPARVFVLARLPLSGAGEDSMRLYQVTGPDQRPLTPVFSSMVKAAAFLEGAQAAGVTVAFDYVFPTEPAQFAIEFAAFTPILDPPAAEFFHALGLPPPG
ncbi:MAG TPA: hypothetical protein VET65_08460 [Candidatus Limnocylindrales bacterium]|nr:hypothetical protein [Candidatus Limnocylindrales bacterium]